MGHGLKLIMLNVQTHIAALEKCHNPPLVRDKPLGAPAPVKLVYSVNDTEHRILLTTLSMSVQRKQVKFQCQLRGLEDSCAYR